ncbi:hypothetical protein [Sinimarinibacterium sp. NLF-5-8]|uniref:hypothetical protein n=1 Tax=Sinimarinibacterium sp. NLF-5-8 TaxID=2698684 RepID=UPI00137BAC3B|nr:hypothetical protein [Sinimarinibacterium sp. NLF-5-8]QHS09399.1 hypothetical protein GT972_03990 [Sinimarinibacterium sp. NLF-5-8]
MNLHPAPTQNQSPRRSDAPAATSTPEVAPGTTPAPVILAKARIQCTDAARAEGFMDSGFRRNDEVGFFQNDGAGDSMTARIQTQSPRRSDALVAIASSAQPFAAKAAPTEATSCEGFPQKPPVVGAALAANRHANRTTTAIQSRCGSALSLSKLMFDESDAPAATSTPGVAPTTASVILAKARIQYIGSVRGKDFTESNNFEIIYVKIFIVWFAICGRYLLQDNI